MGKSTFRIVRETQVNTPLSLLTIKGGEETSVACAEFSPLTTVRSAATRLNQRAGFCEFEVSSPDNGQTIVIKRNKR